MRRPKDLLGNDMDNASTASIKFEDDDINGK